MAEKGLLIRVYSLVKDGSNYTITADCAVSNGDFGTYLFTVEVSAASYNPLLPTWRTLLRDAIVNHALNEWNITVDGVMFPDFGYL